MPNFKRIKTYYKLKRNQYYFNEVTQNTEEIGAIKNGLMVRIHAGDQVFVTIVTKSAIQRDEGEGEQMDKDLFCIRYIYLHIFIDLHCLSI